MKNKNPMSVRIVEKEYSQTLMRVETVEISNNEVSVVHENGDRNVAEFTSPASIFLMVNKVTIDHIKK